MREIYISTHPAPEHSNGFPPEAYSRFDQLRSKRGSITSYDNPRTVQNKPGYKGKTVPKNSVRAIS